MAFWLSDLSDNTHYVTLSALWFYIGTTEATVLIVWLLAEITEDEKKSPVSMTYFVLNLAWSLSKQYAICFDTSFACIIIIYYISVRYLFVEMGLW